MRFYLRLIVFFVGFLLGIILAGIYIQLTSYKTESINRNPFQHVDSYNKWLEDQKIKRTELIWDSLRYGNKKYNLESHFLFNKTSVLCMVLIRNEKNLKAARDTWTKGCNGVQYVNLTSATGKNKLPVKRTKQTSSWVQLCKSLFQINDDYNWILVVNDYTFVILENLRYFLSHLNHKDSYYFGHAVRFWGVNYNMGQAGYVLSKGSLDKLKEKLHNSDTCITDLTYWNKEDFYLGKHLNSLNITPSDTRDEYGLSTFHPYNWYHVFFPGEGYYKLSVYPEKCCSKRSVAFQAIEGDKMYTYYYLFYILQLFNEGNLGNVAPPFTIADDEVWKTFLRERNMLKGNISSYQYYKVWEDLIEDPNSFAKNMRREQDFDNNF